MLGDSSDDRMAKAGASYLMAHGINVLTMSAGKKDYGYHSFPLERFSLAIDALKKEGNEKIGICGASTTAMIALAAASYYPSFTLTLAFTPCDFVMEGLLQDGLDGAKERPADGESVVTFKGQTLPFLPYAYRHPEYWFRVKQESKEGGDFLASKKLFEESERLHPVTEEMKIKVENIKGTLVFVGAEDDVLWPTCLYIRRMRERLNEKKHDSNPIYLLYEHGTHFVFPDSLLKKIFPFSSLILGFCFRAAKKYKKECKETRIDIEKNIDKILNEW